MPDIHRASPKGAEARKVFIFVDRDADERKAELAETEEEARMKLGEKWDDPERTMACPPREIAELPDLIQAALRVDLAAHAAMVAANLVETSLLKAQYERRAAERRELEKLQTILEREDERKAADQYRSRHLIRAKARGVAAGDPML